ncbi:MAG: elongation factor P [Candidatus Brocadiia bacterium]
MITSNDLKKGMTLVVKGTLHQVLDFQHIKPGKGPAFVRTKLRNLDTGAVLEHTFRAKEPVEQAFVEKRPLEYIYRDGTHYVLMDPETYEQMPVPSEVFGGKEQFLKENTQVLVAFHGQDIIDVQLPDSVVLEVEHTQPGVRGDTVSGATKPARLETGATVQVPLFVEEGEKIRVDTRSGEYLERA